MLSQINSVIYCTTQIMQVVIFIAGCYFSVYPSLAGERKREGPQRMPSSEEIRSGCSRS